MCGICGIVHFNEAEIQPSALTTMMQLMKHRGPDDEDTFIHERIGLGHVRLSIIDLSADGKQPMHCSDSRYTIVYNGEIYNYLELKQELGSYFRFRTATDTEVLLNAWKKWGADCLDHLNGMFAFVIYDRLNKTTFLARDRFGIKPLYYYHDHDRLIFASEIKPILSQLTTVSQNDDMLYDFLVHDRVQHTAHTFFGGVKMLPPGHRMQLSGDSMSISRWYNLSEKQATPFSSASEYAEALERAAQLRMRSDVEVGACLSGGLDSSSIVSLMLKKLNVKDFHTFSAVYEQGERGDESTFINLYRPELKKMHSVHPSADSLQNDLIPFIRTMEEPLPGLSEYAEYKVMQLAKSHATVILNGQGADEVLAGYHYFFGFYFKQLLNELKWLRLGSEAIHYLRQHRSSLALASMVYFYLPDRLREQLSSGRKGYLNREFLEHQKNRPSPINDLYNSKDLYHSFLNHFEYKFQHHLVWGDKSSMSQSLELRFPFLDHHLVEKTLALPADQLIRKGQTKYILREAMKGILPEQIRLRQDKVGFETPAARWLRAPELRPLIFDILHSDQLASEPYISRKKALALYQRHLEGKTDASGEIWKIVNLELWFKNFIV